MIIKKTSALLLTAGAILTQPLMAAGTVPAYSKPGAEAVLKEAKTEASANAALSDVELAQKLANPVASMISLPMQLSYTENWGQDGDGSQYLLNIQPVIPFSINDDWNIISRTILPVIRREHIDPRHEVQGGIGDVVQSVFFSPVKPVNGWILGAGPVFLLPTGTNDLSAKKWGTGPTIVALKQMEIWGGHLTYGGLANHIWSTGGSDEVTDNISRTFLNPFMNFTNSHAYSFIFMSEATYDWDVEEWEASVFLECFKLTNIGNQKVSYGGGLFYTFDRLGQGADDLGVRLVFTMLFPK